MKSSETLPCCFREMNFFMKSLIHMNPCLSFHGSSCHDHSTLVCGEMSQIDRFSLGPMRGVLRGGVTVLEGAGILARGTGSCT